MRTKQVVLALAIIAALFLPGAGAKAIPDVPILQVDTLANLGKTQNGEAGGALFLPDGNIIALWKGRPLIIDSKTGKIVRKLDSIPANQEYVSNPQVSKYGLYFLTESTKGLAFFEISTGHIIKYVDKIVDYCLTADGEKMYASIKRDINDPGIIVEYDMHTLEKTDRFLTNDLTAAGSLAISPDGQTIAVSAYKKPDNEYDKKTNQVILIDLEDKENYTILETFESGVYSMEFSPDGQQIAFKYDNGNFFYIYLYNILTKEKKYIKGEEISNIFGATMAAFGKPDFIDNNTIIFGTVDYGDLYRCELIWNIQENKLKNICKLMTLSIDIKDSTILLINQFGVIAYLNKNDVPVKDIVINNESYLKYSNSQLEYFSNNTFIGELSIYDTTGKLIANLGSNPFVLGKNIIKVNQPLPSGTYILTIKAGKEHISKKFMVER